MATPTLSRHRLDGTLGDILVDVRAGGRESPRPAVVVMHGFKGFKDWGMFPPFAERLARAGFAAVTFNTSGSGVDDEGRFSRPERFARNTYSAELADLDAVVSAVAAGRLDVAAPSAVGLVGHSRGGGVAVLQTVRDPRIRALATWAGIADASRWPPDVVAEWRRTGSYDVINTRTGQVLPMTTDILDDLDRCGAELDVGAAAARVTVPWLVVHGTADEAVPVGDADTLAAASTRPTTELLRIDGAGHTFGAVHPWTGSTPALETVFARTIGWMARHLA